VLRRGCRRRRASATATAVDGQRHHDAGPNGDAGDVDEARLHHADDDTGHHDTHDDHADGIDAERHDGEQAHLRHPDADGVTSASRHDAGTSGVGHLADVQRPRIQHHDAGAGGR
jgi:hypothetical protein